MVNGIESLDTIKMRLNERDDVLTRSLGLLEHEREIIRRELELVDELRTFEAQRVAAEVRQLPTAAAAPVPERAIEPEPEPAPTAQAESEKPAPVMVAVPVFEAEPEPVPVVEAARALRVEREEKLQRFRESLASDAPVPDPVPRAADVGLLQRVEQLERVGRP